MNRRLTDRLGIVIAGLVTMTLGCGTRHTTGTEPFLEASRNQRGEVPLVWETVRRFQFNDAAAMQEFRVVAGEWKIEQDKLWAVAGNENRAILLARFSADPMRIEFDATCYADAEGRLGDITVLLDSSPGKDYFGRGYALTTGSYWNQCTSFYRRNQLIARTEYSPVISGQRNHVVVERRGGHLRYWMNGQILLEAWDETPIAPEPSLWIGIRTWATRMSVANVTLLQPKPPNSNSRTIP